MVLVKGKRVFGLLTAVFFLSVVSMLGSMGCGTGAAGNQPETMGTEADNGMQADKEESWDVFAMAIDQMKPFAIKKNRPETPKNKRNEQTAGEDEEEDEVFDPTRNPFDPNQKNRRKAGGIQQY